MVQGGGRSRRTPPIPSPAVRSHAATVFSSTKMAIFGAVSGPTSYSTTPGTVLMVPVPDSTTAATRALAIHARLQPRPTQKPTTN